MREPVGAVRHPETGEFPTIVVSATSLEDMKLRVEGSPELLALVNERLELTSGDARAEGVLDLRIGGSGLGTSDRRCFAIQRN